MDSASLQITNHKSPITNALADSGREQIVQMQRARQGLFLVYDEEGGDLGFLHERESRGGEGFRIDRLGPRVKAVAGRAGEKTQVGLDQPPQVAVADDAQKLTPFIDHRRD